MTTRILSARLTPLTLFAFAVACSGTSASPTPTTGVLDANGDRVADDLGKLVKGPDGYAEQIDINHDGKLDGIGIDTNGDGVVDALLLDTDCDGIYDSYDVNGDGVADFVTGIKAPAKNVPNCNSNPITSGAGGSGGAPAGGAGGTSATGGAGASQLGVAQYQGAGDTTDRYAEADILRNGVGYKFIANGWGSGWQSHHITWNGTSFNVASLNGSQGADYSPAGYPSMFCGFYSMKQSMGTCGLPVAIASVGKINTGWRWKANGNNGQYNAAWDIWLGNGNTLSAYLMVWLRDPPGQQPAGRAALAGATVAGLPGTWSIWTGSVQGHPIVNYVSAEGQDRSELEYDVMDVYRDAMTRGYALPGTHVMAVAVGYEVWNGPVTNLTTEDFYVDVH